MGELEKGPCHFYTDDTYMELTTLCGEGPPPFYHTLVSSLVTCEKCKELLLKGVWNMEPSFIEEIARVTHEANRAIQTIQKDPEVSPPWDEAPEWQRASAKDGVREAIKGATPEELHDNWSRFKESDGWVYGEIKDEVSKTHPCLVPYDQLPSSQRLKDHVFQSIVHGYLRGIGQSVKSTEPEPEKPKANLGLATTGDLLEEVRMRVSLDYLAGGGGLGYTTMNGRPDSEPLQGEVGSVETVDFDRDIINNYGAQITLNVTNYNGPLSAE